MDRPLWMRLCVERGMVVFDRVVAVQTILFDLTFPIAQVAVRAFPFERRILRDDLAPILVVVTHSKGTSSRTTASWYVCTATHTGSYSSRGICAVEPCPVIFSTIFFSVGPNSLFRCGSVA